MRPYPEEVLKAIQTGVMTHFLPELKSSYAQAQFAFAMMLLTIAQRDYDSAVPDLLEANAALRSLLGTVADALPTVDRDDARAAADAIAALPEPSGSLRLSDLRAENDALRAVFAGMAGLIEPAADVAALAPLQQARADAYALLAADARRRVVPILTN